MLRVYAPRVELQNAAGGCVRHIPGPLAKAMIAAGAATVEHGNGRIRAIKLVESASTHLHRIGGPSTDTWHSPPFATREKLDNGFVVWKHHPRATY